MDLGLGGKRALVTGASKGIGLEVARVLAAEGAFVVAAARGSTPELQELVDAGRAQHVGVDLSTPQGPGDLVARALEGGPIEILVNNAGAVKPRVGGFASVTEEEWAATLDLTFLAAVRTTRAVLPGMLAAGSGAIVTVASVNAFLPDPAVIDYGAAKAALWNFCKSLSKEVGPKGIRVNTVSPGPVTTGLWLGQGGVAAEVSKATGLDPKAVADHAVSESATGRFSTAEEVASLIAMLASDRIANVTGSDFTIDGGLVATL